MKAAAVADRNAETKASAIRISLQAGFSTAEAAGLAGTSPRYARAVKARMNRDRAARNLYEDVGWLRERVRTGEIAIDSLRAECRKLHDEIAQAIQPETAVSRSTN